MVCKIINAEAKVRGKVIEFRSFLTFFCTRRGSERGSAHFAINAFGDEALRTTITCPVDVLALPRCSTIDSLPIHTAESAALSWEEEGKSTDDEYDEEKAIEISATNAEIFSLERNVHRGV